MKRMLVIAMVALTAIVSAQVNPEVAFRAAMETETVKGDLRAAIEQYKVIAESGNRSLAAQALVRMAGCYVKLNNDEARRVLERVVRDFADQSSATAEARLQLEALPGTPRPRAGIALRRIQTMPRGAFVMGNLGGNGRYLGYANQDWNLMVRDLLTGQERPVTFSRDNRDYVNTHAFSRDGSRLVYSWVHPRDRLDRPYRVTLHLTTLRPDLSSESRLLLASEDDTWIDPSDWSPDGSLVAVSIYRPDSTRQIGIVSVADGSLRVLKSTGWRLPGTIAFSPDGRYLAFDLPREDSDTDDVFTLAVDGSGEETLVASASDDDFVAWSPDGHVLFQSDRGGQLGLWSVAVRNGAAEGRPYLLRSSIEPSFSPLGFNSQGDLLYGVSGSLSEPSRVQTARVNFSSDVLESLPENVTNDPGERASYPEWSRDGRILGHLTYQIGRVSPVLTLRSVASGAVTVVNPRLRYLDGFSFAPDGQSVIANGSDFRGRSGLFRIELPSGDAQLIVPGDELKSLFRPVWSRDGSTLFYARNAPEFRSYVARELATGREREIARGKLSGVPPQDVGELGGFNLSPDEQYIATVNRLQKPFAIILISVKDGTSRTMLQSSSTENAGIRGWAPDSRAFYANTRSTDGKRVEVVKISIDGEVRPAPGLSSVRSDGQFLVQPGGSLIAFQTPSEAISSGNSEVWALENILPAIKGGR